MRLLFAEDENFVNDINNIVCCFYGLLKNIDDEYDYLKQEKLKLLIH